MFERKKYNKITKIFKALSHPLRLFLIERLVERERCVCELTDMAEFDNFPSI